MGHEDTLYSLTDFSAQYQSSAKQSKILDYCPQFQGPPLTATLCQVGVALKVTHRSQLVKAGEELIEGHDQFLGSALGCQAGEALDVSKQDAGRQEEEGFAIGWVSVDHTVNPSILL